MANNSGSSSEIISLPKGGGALQGIGEKFSPDLFTGTGNFTVPIALPPGRNGFQPELNLVYSTGNGNGPFGLGWSLSIPGVSRKTSKGVPRYDDKKDVFLLSGAEDLVPVEESETETRYRPRTEGLFAQIVHHRDGIKDYWEVRSKDGLKSFYGTEERPDDGHEDWQDPAVIADPAKRDKVFAWKLTRTEDPFKNRIEYEYERDSGEDGPHHWDQLYLRRIRYADYTTENGDTDFLISVTFEYEDRPDPFSEYRPGFEIRTRKRCERIEITTHAGEARLVRTYELVYLDERDNLENLENLLPLNGVSLLSQTKVVGHDGDETEELRPLEFGYTRFEPEGRDFFPLEGRDLPARSLTNPDLELVDVFGNGLPDVLEMNGAVRYWRNLGSGRLDLPRPMREAPAGLDLAQTGVQLIDANGNGRIDLLVTTEGLAGYYPLRFGGLWDRRSFQRYEMAPSFNLEDPEVRLIDLDGDGVTDAIRSGSRLECFFNDPQEGWNSTRWVERQALDEFPNINFSDARVRWADMSGDGLQDIVLVYDGNIEYWPNLGHGDWGNRVSMRNSPHFSYGYDPGRILVGDVDGDGLADIVYVDDTEVTLWINQSGNGWSDPIEIQGTPPVSDMDAVRLADMLSTGISGVLWSTDASVLTRANQFFLDFTRGTKPYLLNEMDNHMGAVTRVEYATSARFYLEDEKRPETRWKTPLPFPVQVVARVEVIDHISRGLLTTEYSYHHGYWDGAEREFRGFGRVDQWDTEEFKQYHDPGLHPERTFEPVDEAMFSPPTETRTWFHQGPIGDEFGKWEETDFSGEFWEGDANLLSRPDSMIDFLRGLQGPLRRAKRDALRTLRGHILRTELYALDDTERQNRPYTVTEYVHGVCAITDENGEAKLTHAVTELPSYWITDDSRKPMFFPHTLKQRVTQWERGEDPMTQVTFTDDYDAYGQPQQQTAVALPRRKEKRQPVTGAVVGTIDGEVVNETRILAAHTRTECATPDAHLHIHDRVAQVRTFELRHPPEVDESDPKDLAQVLADQAAGAEQVHERFRELLDDWSAGQPVPNDMGLLGHTLNHYDGQAFVGRPSGEVGPYGALTRSESLVLTDEELEAAYGDRQPTYLGGSAPLPTGAPSDFGSNLGYRLEQASPEGHHAGYYIDTQRQEFDFQDNDSPQQRGLVIATEDALGHRSTIEPDRPYWLLPERVVDPIGLETTANYDYRVMQPSQVTDPNENAALYRYTPLGLPHKIIVRGRNGEGGTDEKPETKFTYDFFTYERTRDQPDPQPIYVHTRQRVRHASDDVSRETIESREYSDGFGRLLQTRAQAEELVFGEMGDDVGLPPQAGSEPEPAVGRRVADRVVVSGWQVYDNKGQVVEKYEPFFATGWQYQPDAEAREGQHATLYYDPRGQVIRTVNPDGSEQRVVFGIPLDLRGPTHFSPTPWESYTYDPNDLAPLSYGTLPDGSPKPLAERAPVTHHYTPVNTVLDALGRVICQVERNGSPPEEYWYITRSAYDIRGNLLEVIDALGRPAFEHGYDLLDNPLRVDSIDAGLRTSVLDATGNLVEYRDGKGSIVLRQYDDLNRITELRARSDTDARVTLREHLIYGDDEALSGMDWTTARQSNLLGRLFKHYDEAGLQRFDRYDFKGNLEEKTRRVVSDAAIANGWIADWSADDSEDALDDTIYQTSTRYDALNRPLEIIYPEDATGHRATLKPRYNRGGALEKVQLDGDLYVTQIAYNPKGQRMLVAYGNRVMTRYEYDPHSFRLARLRSERYQESLPPDTWTPTGAPLQDLTYKYDLVGNITSIEDCTPGSGVGNSLDGRDRLLRHFEYDPLYRLTLATGRACKDIGPPRPVADLARCGAYEAPFVGGTASPNQSNAPDLTELYTETYHYDPVGNLLELGYTAGSGNWTRDFGMGHLLPDEWQDAPNNRLTTMMQNGLTHSFGYDDSGNMVRQNTERRYAWDHADRMIAFTIQPEGSAQPSVEARYVYGADGMRVKKWVRTNGTRDGESTRYIDGVFEHYTDNAAGLANNHLHVMDDEQRVALVRGGPAHPKDAGPPVQYHLFDHLGSSNVVIDGSGDWINREEHTPYGETSFGSFAKKRYRFAGKERDEESGLYYHGARYHAPWLARWLSADPARAEVGIIQGAASQLFENSTSLYAAFRLNPVCYIDPDGRQPKSPISPSRWQLFWRRFAEYFIKGEGPGDEMIREAERAREIAQSRHRQTAEIRKAEPQESEPPRRTPKKRVGRSEVPRTRPKPPGWGQRGFISAAAARTMGLLGLAFAAGYLAGTAGDRVLHISDRAASWACTMFACTTLDPAEYPNFFIRKAMQTGKPLSAELEEKVRKGSLWPEYEEFLKDRESSQELAEREDFFVITKQLPLPPGFFSYPPLTQSRQRPSTPVQTNPTHPPNSVDVDNLPKLEVLQI